MPVLRVPFHLGLAALGCLVMTLICAIFCNFKLVRAVDGVNAGLDLSTRMGRLWKDLGSPSFNGEGDIADLPQLFEEYFDSLLDILKQGELRTQKAHSLISLMAGAHRATS